MRKPKKGQSLAEKYPEIAVQWHPTKNGELTALDVSSRSGVKIWWKCKKGDDHEWKATPDKRVSGRNCPVCVGKKVVASNSLAILKPKIAIQWHYTKNGNLTPSNVTVSSNKKVWWKCEIGDDHVWEAMVGDRTSGKGCSVCANRRVVTSNSLATTNPEISKEWHPTKNGDLTPLDVTSGSHTKVWWRCNKSVDHEWLVTINQRLLHNCPICSNQKLHISNCLATTHPEIANDWHPTKNEDLTPYDIISGGRSKVWWKCEVADDHQWQASIPERKMGRGCSICAGKTIVDSNCLSTTHPQIAKEWNYEKNDMLSPKEISHGSDKVVWWKCMKGNDHEWEDSVSHRTLNDRGCAVCSGKRVVKSNCVATTHPNILNKWHPTKNSNITPYTVTQGSHLYAWWQCEKNKDHTWKSRIYSSNKHGCPYCTLTPQSKQELTITFELTTLFPDINPRGFKTRVEDKLWTIDIYISSLNLGIEFDGHYWHKDKSALDRLKTKKLEGDGFSILRVREEPLKKISDSDIMSKQPFNAKEVTINILTHIMNSFELEDTLVRKIKAYISKKKLQNEKGLDEYIEMILTEKAKKYS